LVERAVAARGENEAFGLSDGGHLLARRLSSSRACQAADSEAVRRLPLTLRSYCRDQVLMRQGDAPADLSVVVDGIVGRTKMTRRGKRQIVGLLLPGDVFDWPLFRVNAGLAGSGRVRLDHTLCALTRCAVASVRTGSLLDLMAQRPDIVRAFEVQSLIEQSVGREWLVSVGSRAAAERVAHLFCELYHRMRAVGLTTGSSFHLPLRQSHISESQGLSLVHTNRVLQRMRADELIALNARTLTLLQIERLEAFADFSPAYLGPA
jgi:CRP-like cAMP-binding protein